jgi:hypothetical protein
LSISITLLFSLSVFSHTPVNALRFFAWLAGHKLARRNRGIHDTPNPEPSRFGLEIHQPNFGAIFLSSCYRKSGKL